VKKPGIEPNLVWRVDARVPFDWQWSKNRMWEARAGTYARRLADHARTRRDTLAMILGLALRKERVQPVENELWFGVHVWIPDRRGDAINCLDLVADAIEIATEVDDRWYQLGGLTWELDRAEPALFVWIGQEFLEPHKRRRSKPPPPEPAPDPGHRPPWSA